MHFEQTNSDKQILIYEEFYGQCLEVGAIVSDQFQKIDDWRILVTDDEGDFYEELWRLLSAV